MFAESTSLGLLRRKRIGVIVILGPTKIMFGELSTIKKVSKEVP
jgi:hypothetical protein